jgi:hypothetical protein
LVEYDAPSHRVWILGRRWHHGATGTIVAATACVALLAHRPVRSLSLAGLAVGGALMAHDWNDRALWFERGAGSRTQV